MESNYNAYRVMRNHFGGPEERRSPVVALVIMAIILACVGGCCVAIAVRDRAATQETVEATED